jgi:hypothetical protein
MRCGISSFARCESLVEPFTAVRQPPTEDENWECGCHTPPEWQNQIGEKTDTREAHPENLALHRQSLACFREFDRESLANLCRLRYNEGPTVGIEEAAP